MLDLTNSVSSKS